MQKPWFLQRSMPSCTFPRNLHRNAKHYVGLPRFILKTKHQSSFMLPKILLKIDSECDTMSKTKQSLQGSSKTPPKPLQDASGTPSRRLQAASKPHQNRSPVHTGLQAASKQRQRLLKTPPKCQGTLPSSLQDASKTAQDVAKALSKRHEL